MKECVKFGIWHRVWTWKEKRVVCQWATFGIIDTSRAFDGLSPILALSLSHSLSHSLSPIINSEELLENPLFLRLWENILIYFSTVSSWFDGREVGMSYWESPLQRWILLYKCHGGDGLDRFLKGILVLLLALRSGTLSYGSFLVFIFLKFI